MTIEKEFKQTKVKNNFNSYTCGKNAENKAVTYLKNIGWKIIGTNYKTSYGEIDILATKDNILVAFEVKTRKNNNILYYTISNNQQKRIANALLFFLANNKTYYNFIVRFDALFIINNNNKINHIENAWSSNE